MVDESASLTVQLLGISQSVSVFNYVRVIAVKFYGMRLLQPVNVFGVPESVLYFIEIRLSHFRCFLKLFYMSWYSIGFWNQMCILC
jgi:hypothetical protein